MPSDIAKTDRVHIKIISDNSDVAQLPAFKTCKHLTAESWSKGIKALSTIVQQEYVDILYLSSSRQNDNVIKLCKSLKNDIDKGLSIFVISIPSTEAFIKKAYKMGVKAFVDIPVNNIHFEHQLERCMSNALIKKSISGLNRRKVLSHQLAKLCDFTWNLSLKTFDLSVEAKQLLKISGDFNVISNDEFMNSIHEIGRSTAQAFFQSVDGSQIEIRTKIQIPLDTYGYNDVLLTAELDKSIQNDIVYHGCLQNISTFNNRQGASQDLAYHDSLTGLANRRYLMDHLQNLILKSEVETTYFSLLFLDLDGFKQVNDQLGHETGDLLLIEVTDHLQQTSPDDAFIARLGGDEFCIILEGEKDAYVGSKLSQKILKDFKYSIFLEQFKIHTSFSIGVACYPNHGNSVTELLKAADTAMYEAKSKGKNRYELYTHKLTEKTLKRITLEKELFQAFEHEQFELYYQPQINLFTQKIVGIEALIRWIHPTKGMISPDQFIPLSEETRQINNIGEWVLNKACEDTKKLHDKGMKITVAVNVSPVQLHYGNFYEKVSLALQSSGLEAEYLELEITESSFQVSDSNIDVFNNLRELGVQLAIDDFGTGYSNLASLNQLPVDILKIDRDFIKDIPQDDAIAGLTGSIIGMAKMKQLKIIAEGIETPEQIQYLQGVNCDIAQGYLIGKPMEFSQIKMYLKREESGNSNGINSLGVQ